MGLVLVMCVCDLGFFFLLLEDPPRLELFLRLLGLELVESSEDEALPVSSTHGLVDHKVGVVDLLLALLA